jgi:hypothetical protein
LSIDEYALAVANAWGLGLKGKDNGVLLAIDTGNKRLRIEVGRGLERVLSNQVAKDIIANSIVPHFRRGNPNAGVIEGVRSITARLAASAQNETGCAGLAFDREVAEGRKAREQMVRDHQWSLVRDASGSKRLGEMLRRLRTALGSGGDKWQGWLDHGGWEIWFVDMGHDGPTAMGGAAGMITLDPRLLNLTEDELAFVVAHEVAHVVLCHPWIAVEFQEGTVSYRRLIDNMFCVEVVPNLERLTDEWALWLMHRAGYDAEKGLLWLENRAAETSGLKAWINRHVGGSHPDVAERLTAGRATVRRLKEASTQ